MLYEDLSTVLSKIKLATTCSDTHYQRKVVVASLSLETPHDLRQRPTVVCPDLINSRGTEDMCLNFKQQDWVCRLSPAS